MVFRKTIAPLAGLVLLVGACAPAAPAPQAPQTGGAQPPAQTAPERNANQKFAWGRIGIWSTLDPTTLTIDRSFDIYEGLTIVSPDGKQIEPLLATSWRNVDPVTWEFKLRPNSKWHDGTNVTADDVKWSFDHYTDPAVKSPLVARIPLYANAKVVDPLTVQLITKSPDPVWLRNISTVPILPQKAYETLTADQFRVKGIGSGPYKVKEWRADDRLVLEPFLEHPTFKSIFTEVLIRAIPETSARVAGLRTGELDMIDDIPPDQVDTFKRDGYNVVPTKTGSVFGFWTDSILEGSPTRDKRVRLAMNYAIDREAIIKTIFAGTQLVAQGQIASADTFGFNPALKAYPFDRAKARQLLTEAGYPNGFKTQIEVRLTTTVQQSLIQYVQSQFKEVGIDAEIVSLPQGPAVRDKFFGDQQRAPLFYIEINNRPAMDASFALTWFRSTNPGSNGFGTKHYDNPEFDKLFVASTTELDVKKREQLLQQMLQILYDDPPYLAVYDATYITAAKADIEGIIYRVPDYPQFFKAFRKK